MPLPFFYINDYNPQQNELILNEETSKHVVQVLRMKAGEQINLTDGKGNLLNCEIINDHKKQCAVAVKSKIKNQKSKKSITIAISLVKNASRFEWFLEKATEIGVTEIIPLICERTEKEKFRMDRMQGIVISAMLQSQQTWMPVLYEPRPFENLVIDQLDNYQKLIAHCIEEQKQSLNHQLISTSSNHLILIGPEGDFTLSEIKQALQNDFIPVALGNTRLRTETAGIVAATLLCLA